MLSNVHPPGPGPPPPNGVAWHGDGYSPPILLRNTTEAGCSSASFVSLTDRQVEALCQSYDQTHLAIPTILPKAAPSASTPVLVNAHLSPRFGTDMYGTVLTRDRLLAPTPCTGRETCITPYSGLDLFLLSLRLEPQSAGSCNLHAKVTTTIVSHTPSSQTVADAVTKVDGLPLCRDSRFLPSQGSERSSLAQSHPFPPFPPFAWRRTATAVAITGTRPQVQPPGM
jgi:hypothetical protein